MRGTSPVPSPVPAGGPVTIRKAGVSGFPLAVVEGELETTLSHSKIVGRVSNYVSCYFYK